MSDLADRSCRPCHGGVPALSTADADALSEQLEPAWLIDDAGHLRRRFEFPDFASAMAFANRIAEVAEEEGHHPELVIGWGFCRVELWTHAIGGLTESDFVLAAKVERLVAT